jgi:hypothetical protein
VSAAVTVQAASPLNVFGALPSVTHRLLEVAMVEWMDKLGSNPNSVGLLLIDAKENFMVGNDSCCVDVGRRIAECEGVEQFRSTLPLSMEPGTCSIAWWNEERKMARTKGLLAAETGLGTRTLCRSASGSQFDPVVVGFHNGIFSFRMTVLL